MIAMLGMYDRPETRSANNAFWARIRDALGEGPAELTRDMDFWEIWRSPDLILAQTCGLPYRKFLHELVSLVGTPDSGVPGCPPGYYCSVLVMRRGSETPLDRLPLLRFAFNDRMSQSGWAAFWAHVPPGVAPKAMVQTGGHMASAQAVAAGQADIASLDAVTWRLIQRHDAWADQLTVIATTAPTPGLPYITARHRTVARLQDAIEQALITLPPQDRETLCLQGFSRIPAADYLAIPMPPE